MPTSSARASSTAYRVYHVGGLRILAVVDAPRRLRLPSLERFQAFTLKRMAFKRVLQGIMLLRADGLVSDVVHPSALIDGLDFEAWLQMIRGQLCRGDFFAAVQWPAQTERGRVYVHLLGSAGEPVAFVKLSAGDPGGRLDNEAAALARIVALGRLPFSVPSILSNGTFQGFRYLALEPLASEARSVRPSWEELSACVRAYAGPTKLLPPETKERTPWWRRVCESHRGETAFNAELCQLPIGGIPVCRAHGDLTLANLAQSDGRLWIIDWEQSDEQAPVLTDELSYFLSLNRRKLVADPEAGVRMLAARFLDGASPQRRADVMLGLAFLNYANRHMALEMVRSWHALEEGRSASPPAPALDGNGGPDAPASSAGSPARETAPAGATAPGGATVTSGGAAPGSRVTTAIISNANAPYRTHLHRRIAREMPEIRLYSLFTHGLGSSPWAIDAPAGIGPVQFGQNDSVYEQGKLSGVLHEWFKGGRVIKWLIEYDVRAVVLVGYNDTGRLRIINWCHAHGIPCLLFGDSNILGDHVSGVKALVKKRFVTKVLRRCVAILPCGRLGKEYFIKYGADERRIFLFPYEPDYEQIASMPVQAIEAAKQKFGLAEGRRRLVFSGRLVPVKRADLLIEAFSRIATRRPDWDLVMVGDGPLRLVLQGRVPPELSGRVIWTGFLGDQAQVTAIYRASDVLVLPSDYEPWALVINEAAAAGMAIVSSDVVGAAAELVRSGVNGRLFPRGNPDALIESLMEVTDANRIDALRAGSAMVLADWRREADPVQGLRDALTFCGVLNASQSASQRQ